MSFTALFLSGIVKRAGAKENKPNKLGECPFSTRLTSLEAENADQHCNGPAIT